MVESELREFLEADTSAVPVDPQFRESLRRRLWRLVELEAEARRRAAKPSKPKPRKRSKRDVAPPRRDE